MLGSSDFRCTFAIENITNEESEDSMHEFTHDRAERLQAAIDKATASKESAMAFLIRAGILDENGDWAPHLR